MDADDSEPSHCATTPKTVAVLDTSSYPCACRAFPLPNSHLRPDSDYERNSERETEKQRVQNIEKNRPKQREREKQRNTSLLLVASFDSIINSQESSLS